MQSDAGIAQSVSLRQEPAPEWVCRSFRSLAERHRQFPLSRSSNDSESTKVAKAATTLSGPRGRPRGPLLAVVERPLNGRVSTAAEEVYDQSSDPRVNKRVQGLSPVERTKHGKAGYLQD